MMSVFYSRPFMKRFLLFFLVFFNSLYSAKIDFDVVVVGSSPIPLLEALYQYHSGKRVLILEEAPECGGAWKSINICGLYPVDLGCHTLGQDKQIKQFLEEYVGCKMVSIDHPDTPFESVNSPNGFYFSGGCHEFMSNLMQLIQKTDIVFLLNHALDSVVIDSQAPVAVIKSKDLAFTTSKIIATPYSRIRLENPGVLVPPTQRTKFYHLYMLIDDTTPPRFSFRTGIGKGISRLMNLTHFAGLSGTGKQLLVFQTYGDQAQPLDQYLEILKKNQLIDAAARIVQTENYIYEQDHFQVPQNIENANAVFELIKTHHLQDMTNYISKWKQVLKPYHTGHFK